MSKAAATIEYVGMPGITQECLDAVVRLIQYDERITKARILTHEGVHCLLLTIGSADLVAVKSGFASGYVGEGPRKFSYLLQLLDAHKIHMDEYDVDKSILNRIDNSALTETDLAKLDALKPVRPQRIYDYIEHQHYEQARAGTLWQSFRPVIPFAIIDPRITDLAITFWSNPDDKLLTGYRRLEDIFRMRTDSIEHGSKLFSQSFLGLAPRLVWEGLSTSEQTGRASLFAAAYSAYRNPRAHREVKADARELLSEFLLLNHLYRLEGEASESRND